MQIVDHTGQDREQWRPGVLTRMRISAEAGADSLCVFEQWCDPGCGAPTHLHTVEEVLTVLAGQAEIWLAKERTTLIAGQSVSCQRGSDTASATQAKRSCIWRRYSPRRRSVQ